VYGKEFKRASNSATTLLLVETANKLLRREWRRGEERFQVPDPASVRAHVQAPTSQEASSTIDINDDNDDSLPFDETTTDTYLHVLVQLNLRYLFLQRRDQREIQMKITRKEREDVAANVGMIVRRMESMASFMTVGWSVYRVRDPNTIVCRKERSSPRFSSASSTTNTTTVEKNKQLVITLCFNTLVCHRPRNLLLNLEWLAWNRSILPVSQ
jgi:hypothetical protein